MTRPCLFIVAHSDCTVRVNCSQSAELRRIEPGAGTPFAVVVVSPLLPYKPEDLRLGAGLYHVMSTGGVSCQILDGSGSTVLAFGEDPWPIPPPPQFGSTGDYIGTATAYLHAT
jgi:hypothetical protein